MAATTDISKLMARFLKPRGPTSPIVSGRNIPTRGPTSPLNKAPSGARGASVWNNARIGGNAPGATQAAPKPAAPKRPASVWDNARVGSSRPGAVQGTPKPTPPKPTVSPAAQSRIRELPNPRSSRGSGKTLAAAGAALTAGVAAGAAVYGGGTGSKAPDTRPNPATVWTGPSAPVRGKPSTGGPTTRPKIGPKPAATRPAPAPQPAPKTPPRTIKTWEQRTAPTANVPMSPKASSPNTGGRQMDDEYGSYYTGQAQRNKKFGRIDR